MARKVRDAARRACQVLIGGQIERWKQLSIQLGVNHEQLAKLLLDRLVLFFPNHNDLLMFIEQCMHMCGYTSFKYIS